MSDSDSFIEEVSEEVRRERLYLLMRRYGWIAILVVVGIVGGAAYTEYSRAQARGQAQALGDGLLSALEIPDAPERRAALEAIEVQPEAAPLAELIKAAEAQADSDIEGAVKILRAMAEDAALPIHYRDLAGLKLALLGDEALPEAERAALLDRLATPGAPFRALALEQQLYSTVQTAEPEEAITAARALLQEPEISAGMRQRATEMIRALGGEVDIE